MNLDDKLLSQEKKITPPSEEEVLANFLNSIHYFMPNLNDSFYYASADTEKISVGEGAIMAKWAIKHGWYGFVAIAALKRNRNPLPEITKQLAYQAAVRDLNSGEIICFEDDPEGGDWRWWFDLPGGIDSEDEKAN